MYQSWQRLIEPQAIMVTNHAPGVQRSRIARNVQGDITDKKTPAPSQNAIAESIRESYLSRRSNSGAIQIIGAYKVKRHAAYRKA